MAAPNPNGIIPRSGDHVGVAAARLTCERRSGLTGGRVLVTGGGSEKSAELYDPAPDGWEAVPPMPDNHWHSEAVLVPGQGVLVTGGWTNIRVVRAADLYDPRSGTWHAVDTMLDPGTCTP